MERSFSEVVFASIISSIVPVSLNESGIKLSIDNFFLDTINTRYLAEIRRCVRAVSGADYDVLIVTPDNPAPAMTKITEELRYARANLRRRYSFETFVKGKSNELAYSAAYAIAETPGKTSYNPLFLYGGVGLGKTHLIQSIGNYVIDKFPEMEVLYQSAESFTNELITAIREKSTQDFKRRYRSCDALLLDDVQFFERTVETQEEMFHTFNSLYNDGKQIVLTSDLPPKELTNIERRLITRFGQGLTVDVTLPDYETRVAIMEKKLQEERIKIPDSVKELIIKNIVSNIRDLEGAINKVTAYARLTSAAITLELAEIALRDQLEQNNRSETTVEFIQEAVAERFGISVEDINGRKRSKKIIYPRQIAMYLSRKLLKDKSLPELGVAFGGRDHTTIMFGCNKIQKEAEANKNLSELLIELEKQVSR